MCLNGFPYPGAGIFMMRGLICTVQEVSKGGPGSQPTNLSTLVLVGNWDVA